MAARTGLSFILWQRTGNDPETMELLNRYWLSVGARPSRPVTILLDLAGILPPHPRSLVTAARNREALAMGALTLDALDEAEKDEEAEDTE